MTYLNTVTSGPSNEGQRIVISGVEGVGKTTLACDTPNSLLIPLEPGYAAIKTPRLPNLFTNWTDVENLCLELRAACQSGKMPPGSSIVWDSASALERIIHAETLNRDTEAQKQKLGKTHSMETAHEGYGKAYAIANNLFERWLGYQNELAKYGGINIIVTCHVFAIRVIDPSAGEYDVWELLLHSPKNNKTFGKRELLTQWADMIGFLHEPIFVSKEKDAKISRGISANQGRMLEIDRSPAWVAKNRYGLREAIKVPPVSGWNSVADGIFKSCGIDLYNRAEPSK